MDHDQLKQLLPLGALDRLENQEASTMAAHLAEGCDECEAELRSLREALAAMAMSVAGDGPAERIWQRLERRLEGAETSGLAEYRRTPGLPAERARERAAETEPHRGVSRRWRIATGLASAAAIMLAVLAVNFAPYSTRNASTRFEPSARRPRPPSRYAPRGTCDDRPAYPRRARPRPAHG